MGRGANGVPIRLLRCTAPPPNIRAREARAQRYSPVHVRATWRSVGCDVRVCVPPRAVHRVGPRPAAQVRGYVTTAERPPCVMVRLRRALRIVHVSKLHRPTDSAAGGEGWGGILPLRLYAASIAPSSPSPSPSVCPPGTGERCSRLRLLRPRLQGAARPGPAACPAPPCQ